MAALTPALGRLRADVDELAPARDRASDGWIGDTAHQAETSDHNDDETGRVPIRDADTVHEVHAVDVDADLREPGLSMEMVVQHLLARCRAGVEDRLRYIIYNRRIWSASSGWVQQPYTGPSAHTEHAHFSGSYTTSREADTRSWHLEDIPVALTAADKTWISAELARVVTEHVDDIARAVGDLPVDIETDQPGVDLQPWSRVDAYARDERAAVAKDVKELRKAVDLGFDAVLDRLPAAPPAGR